MARSKYIYLIRGKVTNYLFAVFTVKHEAKAWVEKSIWDFNEIRLSKMRDGVTYSGQPFASKSEQVINWE